MQREYTNGNDTFFNRNDGDVTGKSYASTFGPQENEQVTETENEESSPEFNQSNRRLDFYHLYFSSRL